MPRGPTDLLAHNSLRPVAERPFPHVLVDGYLETELHDGLAASFPDCPAASGPTGFTVFPGDPEFEQLIAGNAAWAELFGRFDGQAFVDHVLAQFEDVFAAECLHDLSGARYVPYRESREDKERRHLAVVEHAPDELWVRFDVMQARVAYDRGPHLDHRRRAATLLLYFTDADEAGMVGGDLVLHGSSGHESVSIRSRHNRAVMFPCCNASWHSVSRISEQREPRNFVQVSVSSSVDLWAPVSVRTRLKAKLAQAASRLR